MVVRLLRVPSRNGYSWYHGVCETGVIYTSIPGTFFPDSMSLSSVFRRSAFRPGDVVIARVIDSDSWDIDV